MGLAVGAPLVGIAVGDTDGVLETGEVVGLDVGDSVSRHTLSFRQMLRAIFVRVRAV